MRIATVILLLFGVPAAAYAQTAGSSIFVEGAMFANHDPTYDHSNARFTPGGGGTIGFQLTPRFSARFDIEVPAFDTRTSNEFYPGALRSTTTLSAEDTMYASRALAATALMLLLASAFPRPAHASQHATDTAGASHVTPTNSRHAPPGRQSRLRSGWIGVGINTAILVVKIAIPSIARHPLSGT
jgi:hypothetical protein